MRIIGLLLSVVFLYLVSVSFFSNHQLKKSEKLTCCEKKNNYSSNSDKDCCNKGCNPFENCCGMMGFVTVSPLFISFTKLPDITFSFDIYSPDFSTHYGDFWQPPRV